MGRQSLELSEMGMRKQITVVLLILLAAFAGCTRDPEKVKRKYVETGDKYYAQGKFKQAAIMYGNALKQDPKFGEAYLKLGDTELRRGEIRRAINAYRRAIELLPDNEDPAGRLADIYLAGYAIFTQSSKELLAEVEDLTQSLLKKNPNSFHGLRLQGFVHIAKQEPKEAIESFRKADSVKPKQPEVKYALAQVLSQEGQWEEAEKLAKEVMANSPNHIPTYDFMLMEYLKRDQRDKAEQVLLKKVENNPKTARFRTQLASLYYAEQKTAESEKVIGELMAKEKEIEGARMEAGEYYYRIRNYSRAQEIFEEGAKQDEGQRTNYRLKSALIDVAQSKLKPALDKVERALRDDPKNDDALSMRASLQLQTGDRALTQAAITDLQSLLSRAPGNAVIRYNLARAYQGREEWDAARVQYQEAIKLRPDFLGAHVGLGQVLLFKREYGKALEEGENILRLDPENLQGRVIKTNALINSGNLRQARADLELYKKANPESPDLQFQSALVSFYERDFKTAEATFRALRQKYPNDLRLAYAIAEVFLQTGRPDEALRFLLDEQKRFPDNLEVYKAVGNISMRTGALDLAEDQYRFLIGKEPRNTELYMRLGETLRRKGNTQASIDVLRKGQQLQPNDPSTNLQLALTLDAAGLKRESLPIYESIVKNQPDNPIALNNLAFMMAEDGRDLDQALTYAQRARQQLPDNPDIADTLGWIYIRKNLSDNAVSIFKDLTKKYRANPVYHYHLAMALYQKGDREGAKRSLQSALALKPPKEHEDKIRELLGKVS